MFDFERYSRNHCLTSMPNDAVMRLKMREANQSTLTLISDADGWKGCEAASMMLAGGWDVELIIPLTVLYDAVWRAICCITASIWEDVSGDSF